MLEELSMVYISNNQLMTYVSYNHTLGTPKHDVLVKCSYPDFSHMVQLITFVDLTEKSQAQKIAGLLWAPGESAA